MKTNSLNDKAAINSSLLGLYMHFIAHHGMIFLDSFPIEYEPTNFGIY